ncbi:MAG: NAD(P)/FAD-dependent oxidoreductase [Halieaceae bacterium]|nr:NAD(P)/FAD-dependent oxidoreductase [Halieaceae bacterium]
MASETIDVLIIGAGLSGIGAACHLSKKCPDKNYLILEARECMGGTWDLFRYPGIRSDSDMFSLGYNFKPWASAQFLADGPAILNYINEAAAEHGVNDKIRYQAQVESVSWNSDEARWTVLYRDKQSGEAREIHCNFINSCTGYYNYEHGYQPEFDGRENYRGIFIHPQQWPEDLNCADKRVVVIGSGATAVTVVPEMSLDAAHVTMLQRSPTYMAAVPDEDPAVLFLRKHLPEIWVYRISRTLKVSAQAVFYSLSRRFPNAIRKLLLGEVEKRVGPDVDMKHFRPEYNPWDERLCAVKSGDLFEAVKNGSASIVTDHIDHFTETGIKLKSGEELQADIIVSATGLDMKFFGDIGIVVDGEALLPSEKLNYKGVMLEGLPNIGFTFGYTNASWTLKADLTSEWICRLLKHMDKTGMQKVVPVNSDPEIHAQDFLDFQSGYVQRAIGKFPKMGNKLPWRLLQNYGLDLMMLRFGRLNDGKLRYSSRRKKNGSLDIAA